MTQSETTAIEEVLTPQQLAKKLGLSPKATRQLLRSEYPRDAKNQPWQIPEKLARKVQRDYRAKLKEKEAKKQTQVQNELEGKD